MAAAEVARIEKLRGVDPEVVQTVRILLAAAMARALRAGLGTDRVRAMFEEIVGKKGEDRE
jgi:hypothetical protein